MLFSRRPKGQVPEFCGSRIGAVRVVVENVDFAERFIEQQALEEAGYEVVACGGPEELPNGQCPLTFGVGCPAISDADVVVTSFRAESPQGAAIISGLRERYPDTPLIVDAPPLAVDRYVDVLADCEVIYPLTAERLISAVEKAIGVVTGP